MYYPKSQIQPNLYTSGNEYALKTTPNNSYTGYYYKTSSGRYYTGKTPEDGGNFVLIPIKREGDDYEGEDLQSLPELTPQPIIPAYFVPTPTTSPPRERFLPSYNSTKPTEKDYDLGEYQRYFCKKNNELLYLETDTDTYNKLVSNDPKIASDLYTPINTPWTITGGKQTTFDTNKNIITLIERNQKWYGFTNYFQDRFLQYHISELNENLYTSGGEYTLPDGSSYVGWYHKMDNGVVMTGKEHGTGDDIILTSIGSPIPKLSPTSRTSTGESGY